MKKILSSFMVLAAATVFSSSVSAAAIELNANAMNSTAEGTTVPVAAGGSFENATYFPNVNFTFSEYGGTISCDELDFTSDKGLNKKVEVNHMFYDMEAVKDVPVKIKDLEISESGVYTLHVPANFFTLNGNGNDAVDLVWTYTNTTQSSGGDKAELKLTSFTVNNVDMLGTAPKLELLEKGTPVAININPIPEALMLTLKFTNKATGENVRSMEIYNISTNPDVNVDPATGVYSTKVSGRAVNKFFEGTEYLATITAYSSTNAANPANTVWGPVEVTFEGASVAYKYSEATIVSITPEDKSEIIDPSTPIVLTFSAPVAEVTCGATIGGQGASVVDMTDITPNADKTIWTIKPGQAFWNASDSEWTFQISAKDAEGLVVKGNHGDEANSQYWVVYECFLSSPEVNIAPASGMVEELYEFTVTDPEGKSMAYSWSATPYVVNEAGETVTKLNSASIVGYDKSGNVIADDVVGDVVVAKLVFNLRERITTPGKYTLIVPRASFNMGTEFEGVTNKYQAIEYTVVPMVAVNVELADFVKTSFKVAEGNKVSVALTPNADWKLASLKLNDADVTDAVVDNTYTIAGVTEEANLVATYEYAQNVEIVEVGGSLNVEGVEGAQYKVSNTAEKITIEGLQGGEEINVYSANGMRLASQIATKGAIDITLPNGQVYIVMINNKAVKVRH